MTKDFSRYVEEDARLVILRALAEQHGGTLNESLIVATLDSFGHSRSRDWVRTQLRKMEELGAIRLTEAGTVLIAVIRRAGQDHVERRSSIEGIKRPGIGD